jgi:hypothetical protein|tara:strand:- start:4562 stop:6577 length:2016 start_codon:yes stop_codon:yes gene_type:complete
MALNFPDSPSDGQAVILNGNNFVYSSANNQWTKRVGNMIMSDNAPSNPIPGQMWFDTTVLKTFVYYADGSSSQWVEINTSGSAGAPGTFDGTSAVTGNIIPDLDSAYDLGSPTKKFRSLHLSGNTLFLGDSGSISSGAGGAISLPSISIGTGANTIKLEASASGKLETKSTVGGVEQVAVPAVETIEQLSNVDLTIAPEVLEIQVADPTAGHGTAWLWTWLTSSLPYARTSITNSDQLSVPLYMQGTYQINNFANTQYGSMTQVHTFKLKWIEGAGDQNLVSWPTYSVVNHTHASINSGTETSVQRLSFSVPSSITPPSLVAPTVTYTVASGSGVYTFSGTRSGDNPEIGPLRRGGTYTFDLTATGHPFYLTTDNGTNYVSGSYVGEYTTGVTGSRNETGQLVITVDASAPDTLYYQCGLHSSMRGTIVVKDLAVETNENGNYVIYGQHTQEGHKTPIELRPIPALVNQMCLVYDATNSKFVPQDMSTYVENTPSFKNKIKEVAGTATLVAPDGTSLVASVSIYADATYLPAIGNVNGDLAFAEDTSTLHIFKTGTGWQIATASPSDFTNLVQTGALTVTTGTKRWYAPKAVTISRIVARVNTAPAGAAINITVNKNGSSGATLVIADGGTKIINSSPSITLAEDDYLTVDITQIGSGTAGSDLTVTFTYS